MLKGEGAQALGGGVPGMKLPLGTQRACYVFRVSIRPNSFRGPMGFFPNVRP